MPYCAYCGKKYLLKSYPPLLKSFRFTLQSSLPPLLSFRLTLKSILLSLKSFLSPLTSFLPTLKSFLPRVLPCFQAKTKEAASLNRGQPLHLVYAPSQMQPQSTIIHFLHTPFCRRHSHKNQQTSPSGRMHSSHRNAV